MRKFLPLFLFLFLLAGAAFSQHGVTYDIHPGSKYKLEEVQGALEMCDLTKYHKLDKRVKMLFDDDTIVELYSANEVLKNGEDIDLEMINPSDGMLLSLFAVHPDGFIIEWATKLSKEETIERMNKLNQE